MSFIDNFNSLWAKGIFVGVPVMATEQKVEAAWKHYAYVGLSIATITSIGCSECGCSHRGVHVKPSNS